MSWPGWPKYILLSWLVASAISSIAGIGIERPAITHNAAIFSVILLAGLAWLVVIA